MIRQIIKSLFIIYILSILLIPATSNASEYCYRMMDEKLKEIGDVYIKTWNEAKKNEIRAAKIGKEYYRLTQRLLNETLSEKEEKTIKKKAKKAAEDLNKCIKIGDDLNNKMALYGKDGKATNDARATAKMCVEEVQDLNLLVNIGIQALAAYYTGGLSLTLHEKALYVDMGEIIKDKNIWGGPNSVPNAITNKVKKELENLRKGAEHAVTHPGQWVGDRLGVHF